MEHKKEITIARRKKAIKSVTIVFPSGLSLDYEIHFDDWVATIAD